jgi:hypothetical protein
MHRFFLQTNDFIKSIAATKKKSDMFKLYNALKLKEFE